MNELPKIESMSSDGKWRLTGAATSFTCPRYLDDSEILTSETVSKLLSMSKAFPIAPMAEDLGLKKRSPSIRCPSWISSDLSRKDGNA